MATKIKGTGIATGAIDSTQLATLSGHFDLLGPYLFLLLNSPTSSHAAPMSMNACPLMLPKMTFNGKPNAR